LYYKKFKNFLNKNSFIKNIPVDKANIYKIFKNNKRIKDTLGKHKFRKIDCGLKEIIK